MVWAILGSSTFAYCSRAILPDPASKLRRGCCRLLSVGQKLHGPALLLRRSKDSWLAAVGLGGLARQ